jgi:hypothetical protein
VVRLTAQGINLTETTVADVMVHPLITLPQQSAQDIFLPCFCFGATEFAICRLWMTKDSLIGVISHESIRQILRPDNLLRFRRISDVMTSFKWYRPSSPATVLQLAQLMAEHRVSCVVITQRNSEDNDYPVGIVTERESCPISSSSNRICTKLGQDGDEYALISPQPRGVPVDRPIRESKNGGWGVWWFLGTGVGDWVLLHKPVC